MAFLAAVPLWAQLAVAVAGTAMTVAGQRQQARSEAQYRSAQATAKEFEAQQLEAKAIQDVAVAQRSAQEQKRQSRVLQSRALAVAAASGGGASDPTVFNIISDLEGEGAYRSAVAMYEGEDRARTDRMSAEAARYEAAGYRSSSQSIKKAGNISTVGTIFGGASGMVSGGMFGKYGLPGGTS